MDTGGLGALIGGCGTGVGGIAAYFRARVVFHRESAQLRREVDAQINAERLALQRALEECEKSCREKGDRISALETDLVTLRKLLPGGEWYRKLGLDEAV